MVIANVTGELPSNGWFLAMVALLPIGAGPCSGSSTR